MSFIREQDIPTFAAFLRDEGCEVDTERKGYRVLMFRKETAQHTQVFANDRSRRYSVSGPEARVAILAFRMSKGEVK